MPLPATLLHPSLLLLPGAGLFGRALRWPLLPGLLRLLGSLLRLPLPRLLGALLRLPLLWLLGALLRWPLLWLLGALLLGLLPTLLRLLLLGLLSSLLRLLGPLPSTLLRLLSVLLLLGGLLLLLLTLPLFLLTALSAALCVCGYHGSEKQESCRSPRYFRESHMFASCRNKKEAGSGQPQP